MDDEDLPYVIPIPALRRGVKGIWHVGWVVLVHVIDEGPCVAFIVNVGGWADNNLTITLVKEETYG